MRRLSIALSALLVSLPAAASAVTQVVGDIDGHGIDRR